MTATAKRAFIKFSFVCFCLNKNDHHQPANERELNYHRECTQIYGAPNANRLASIKGEKEINNYKFFSFPLSRLLINSYQLLVCEYVVEAFFAPFVSLSNSILNINNFLQPLQRDCYMYMYISLTTCSFYKHVYRDAKLLCEF